MAFPEYCVVPEPEHDRLVTLAFERRGYRPDEVAGMVQVCREAARHGIRTHHALKALHLDASFGLGVSGCVAGATVEDVPGRFPAARHWNAHRKSGPVVAWQAIETGIELAAEFGVGSVSVDEAWHYVWGGAYVLEAARRGYIAWTHCTSLLAEVVPYGGTRPTLGTNPHTWAFPTTDIVGFPLLVDIATSAVASGRVEQSAREGRSLPAGCAVDAEGRETTDPAQVAALLPFGGHKGYCLGLMNEVFAALIGGSLPTRRGRFSDPGAERPSPTFSFLVLHPEALTGGGDWQANLGLVLRDIRGPGNEASLWPGEIEARAAARSRAAGGLLFTPAELDAFEGVTRECGVTPWDRSVLRRWSE